MSSTTRRRRALDPDALAALEEQRDFLLRSLADLDREHAAGDMTDEDHAALKDDYTARAAEVIRAIEAQEAAFAAARRPSSPRRTAAWVAVVMVFAGLAGLLAANAMGARKPGESASGGVNVRQSTTQRAVECTNQMTSSPDAAFECFEDVLEDDPTNAVALTWSAWQLSLAADATEGVDQLTLQATAAIRLDEAVEADPDYSYARAFRAVVAYRNGRYADAQRYLEEFRRVNPSSQAVEIIEQMGLEANIERALAEEGPGPTSTTTTAAPEPTTPN